MLLAEQNKCIDCLNETKQFFFYFFFYKKKRECSALLGASVSLQNVLLAENIHKSNKTIMGQIRLDDYLHLIIYIEPSD